MVEETKRDIYTKVTGIESRVEKDGKRLIEMEKYKLDLVELRDSIYNKQTNTLDYNRWCATVQWTLVTMSRCVSPGCGRA